MEGKTIAELIAMNQQLVTHTSCQTAQALVHSWIINTPSGKTLCPKKRFSLPFFKNNYMMLVFKNLASFSFFCNNGYRWVMKICCFHERNIYRYSC